MSFLKSLIGKKAVLLILLLCSFQMITSYFVLSHSRILHSCDEPGHIITGWNWFQDLKNNKTIDHFSVSGGRPPLPFFFQAMAWSFLDVLKITPPSIDLMIVTVNLFYLAVLLFSVYGIGKILCNGKAGLLAAFLISMFPLVFGHTRTAMLDFPMAAMSALAVFLLLKSEKFSSAMYSMLAGLGFGIAMLTKETAIIPLAAPALYYFFSSLRSRDKRRVIKNSAIFFLFAALLTGAIYLRSESFRHLWFVYSLIKFKAGVPVTQPFFYIFSFPEFTGPLLLLFCLPLVVSHALNAGKRDAILLLCLLVPLIALSTSANFGIRFMLPLSVPVCLICALELFESAFFRKIGKVYIPALVIAAVVQFGLVNCGMLLKEDDLVSLPSERGVFCSYTATGYDTAHAVFETLKDEAGRNSLDVMWLCNAAATITPISRISDYVQLNLMLRQIPYTCEFPMEDEIVRDENDLHRNNAARLAEFYQRMQGIPEKNYIIRLQRRYAYAPLFRHLIETGPRYKITEFAEKNIDTLEKCRYFAESIASTMFEERFKDYFRVIAKAGFTEGTDLYVYKRIK
jgi:hypothetical protein